MCSTLKSIGLLCVWFMANWSCQPKPAEIAPIINTKTVLPSQAALVSVQPTGAATAEVIIKLTSAIGASDWRLTAQTVSGAAVPIEAGGVQLLDVFSLNTFLLKGLVSGQTYRLLLGFRYNQKDTLTLERTYTHTAYNPWKRLAHLSFTDGLFTGSIIDQSDDRAGGIVRLTRYVNDNQWQRDSYSYRTNQWYPETPPATLFPRRGMIEYDLYFHGKDRSYFYGLGYLTDELIPGKYVYQRDLYAILNGFTSDVIPFYPGDPGEIAYFTTTEWAYFLNNNGSPAMRGIYAQFEQKNCAPLPEAPGTLATFSIGQTGYVVNQVPGRQPRLFAYDSEKDVWTRKTDFPGVERSRGMGFQAKGKGYFGLGTAPNQRGLRDLWQYDPASDRWQHSTDYPGQGNTYVVVFSPSNKQTPTYLGFGYENQAVVGASGPRLAGCTDFWEFTP